MTAWIQQPALWDLAVRKAGEQLPTGSRFFWQKVTEIYQDLGGKFDELDEYEDFNVLDYDEE